MRVTVDLDVPGRMRDGTTLRANVYRPEGGGPWPTLLARVPYSKDDLGVLRILDPVQAARRGFMIVMQDCRGRFASDGEWTPFRYEAQDGYDSVEWAANLPGSSGRVGMYGESYLGGTQWTAAAERPPALTAIAPAFATAEPMNGLFARGGAVELGLAVPWSIDQGVNFLQRSGVAVTHLIDEYDALVEEGYRELPVSDQSVLRRLGVDQVGFLRSIDDPDFVAWSRVADRYHLVTVPTFHTGGWHDAFLQGTLDGYMAMSAPARDARLLVGPWTHGAFADPIGDQVYGPYGRRYGVAAHPHGDANDFLLAWFRRHVAGERVDLPEAPVRIFVMGANIWRDEAAWPLARARPELWFLHSGGLLSTAEAAAGEEGSRFSYDPADPVPTLGGPHLSSAAYPSGPRDQSRVEARDDVLIFTSPPLERDLEVTGRVRAVLHADSSAPSTDWVVRLCEVYPDGRSFNLCDGILRTGDSGGRYEVDLWSTSNVFRAGHRLRVQVTSSCFPRWDRNLNTGDQRQSRHVVARQLIHHDASRASYIELPVIG